MTVLVTAASKHGATTGIADAVAEGLERRGVVARSLPPEAVAGLDGYEAAIIGSAIYMGHWMDDAKDFVATHAAPLAAMPVWLFSSGPLGEPGHLKPDDPPVDAAPMVAATAALDHRVFAGKLDKSKLKFTERAMAAAVKAPEGDFRDWEAIDAWAGEIAGRVAEAAPG